MSTKTWQKTVSMSDLDEKHNRLCRVISSNDHDENDTEATCMPPVKNMSTSKKTTRTIMKTASAEPMLFNNATNPSTNSNTIAALFGIVKSPGKSSITLTQPIRVLRAGSFQITLCIDNAEASRSTQKVLLEQFKKNGINFDVRKLNIGDFLWLVRRKSLLWIDCLSVDYIHS
jgi:hypothetical protein